MLLDNCASHKTDMVRRVFASLEVPVVFSAPASFKVVPVELFYAAIKRQNFEQTVTPALEVVRRNNISTLTNKQLLMSKVDAWLRTLSVPKIKDIFEKQLR